MDGFFYQKNPPRCLRPSPVPPCPSTSIQFADGSDYALQDLAAGMEYAVQREVRSMAFVCTYACAREMEPEPISRLMYSTLSKPRPSGMNNGATLHIPFSRVWSRSPCIACLRRGSKIPYRGERAHRGLLRKMPAEKKYFFQMICITEKSSASTALL